MHANWFSWWRFHFLRLARMHPFGLTGAVLLLAIAVAAGLFWLSLVRHDAVVRRDIANLNKSLGQPVASSSSQGSGRLDLPRFEPNKLVEAINRLAQNTKLPLDEITFVLEDNHNQPYLRYRATLSVSSRYPAIRRFLDALEIEQPQVALDAISCERDDINAAETNCDVNLSAFYRRPDHGQL